MRHDHKLLERVAQIAWATTVAVALVALPTATTQAADNGQKPRRPNIILIMADDLGADCLNCYGSKNFRTPHLDRLAQTGVRFENCYATPLCVPSRMEIMTGRYPFRTGWSRNAWGEKVHFDPAKETCFAQLLRSAGYATCVVGKWMLCYDFRNHPNTFRDAGFDEHYMWRLWDTSIPIKKRVRANNPITPGYWDVQLWKDGPLHAAKGKYGPDLFCDSLIDFMTRNRDRPFLAYWPMHIVHLETFHGRTTPPTPDSVRTPGKGDKTGKTIDKQQGMVDMVLYMDKLVGRVVAALDRLGIRDNTLILFTGDNGTTEGIRCEINGHTVTGGKGKLTEAGCRVPLIANWKGAGAEGHVCDDLVDFTDFLPTMVEAAGAKLPRDTTIDGVSFLPQIKGEPGKPRTWVYCQLKDRWFIRDRRWMLYSDGRLLNVTDRYRPKPAEKTPESSAARIRLQRVVEDLRAK